MQTETNKEMRKQRINRLLEELRYEVERGFMESEIDERMGFDFIVPVSRQIKNGIVFCSFETRPVHRDSFFGRNIDCGPRLNIVENDPQKSN